MAAKPETTFRLSVERQLDKALTYCLKNNNTYAGGQADSWYSNRGKGDLWVEYKFIQKLPVRVPIRPYDEKAMLSALQQDWLKERHEEGRNVAVIIGCKSGGVIMRYPEWLRDWPVEEFNSKLKSRKEIADWIATQ